jgi:dihydrofolate synthase/folylpolyglutamate synthase
VCDLPTSRGATAQELQALVLQAHPQATVVAHTSPAEALQAAAAGADPADRIVVFGSFFTVGGVLKNGLPRLSAPHLAARGPGA